MANVTTRSENIHIRAAPGQRNLLEQAAMITSKSLSQFILDSATEEARFTLLDQTVFMLDKSRWDAFVAILDAPVTPKPKLQRLLSTPAPWETEQ